MHHGKRRVLANPQPAVNAIATDAQTLHKHAAPKLRLFNHRGFHHVGSARPSQRITSTARIAVTPHKRYRRILTNVSAHLLLTHWYLCGCAQPAQPFNHPLRYPGFAAATGPPDKHNVHGSNSIKSWISGGFNL